MNLSKNLYIFFFIFIALFFGLSHEARFDITNNCPFTVWAGSSTEVKHGALMLMLALHRLAFGLEQGAISMVLGVADARPVTVAGFSNAKAMV